MMDCIAKNMKAASEKPSSATPWPAMAPIAMPVAMTRYPAISMLRERCSVRANRGSRDPTRGGGNPRDGGQQTNLQRE